MGSLQTVVKGTGDGGCHIRCTQNQLDWNICIIRHFPHKTKPSNNMDSDYFLVKNWVSLKHLPVYSTRNRRGYSHFFFLSWDCYSKKLQWVKSYHFWSQDGVLKIVFSLTPEIWRDLRPPFKIERRSETPLTSSTAVVCLLCQEAMFILFRTGMC